MEHMHKLKALSMLENGATVSEEQWVELTGQPAYRVRAELKRSGIKEVTREVALAFIAKRNEDAVLALAAECRKAVNELARNNHHLDMLIKRNDELELRVKTTAKKGRPSKLPNLKPSYFGTSVYLRELAEWAGISVESLRAQMESLEYMFDEIQYSDDTLTLTVKGANDVAKALNLEPKE